MEGLSCNCIASIYWNDAASICVELRQMAVQGARHYNSAPLTVRIDLDMHGDLVQP